jgi:hypothetical protein
MARWADHWLGGQTTRWADHRYLWSAHMARWADQGFRCVHRALCHGASAASSAVHEPRKNLDASAHMTLWAGSAHMAALWLRARTESLDGSAHMALWAGSVHMAVLWLRARTESLDGSAHTQRRLWPARPGRAAIDQGLPPPTSCAKIRTIRRHELGAGQC